MRSDRQQTVLRLIREHKVETQQQLATLLQQEGYQVTQATVSRDIRRLGLTKASVGGVSCYVHARQGSGERERYINVLREGFQSADTAGNILVVKTVAGMAMAVAAAIDAMEFEQVVGSIAGDDTIMIAIKSEEAALELRDRLKESIE